MVPMQMARNFKFGPAPLGIPVSNFRIWTSSYFSDHHPQTKCGSQQVKTVPLPGPDRTRFVLADHFFRREIDGILFS
jgi:hypothetical protein